MRGRGERKRGGEEEQTEKMKYVEIGKEEEEEKRERREGEEE